MSKKVWRYRLEDSLSPPQAVSPLHPWIRRKRGVAVSHVQAKRLIAAPTADVSYFEIAQPRLGMAM